MSLSALHEALVQLCRSAPDFVAYLAAEQAGAALPAYSQVDEASAELTEAVPLHYSADAVLLFSRDNQAVLAVVVEVQRQPDEAKRWRWPQYLASVSAKHRCQSLLVVICPDAETATWAMKLPQRDREAAAGLPILQSFPIVIGPEQISPVSGPDGVAVRPEEAVLSIIVHGQSDPTPLAGALSAALLELFETEPDRAQLYNDLVIAALPGPAARQLEKAMSTTIPSFTHRITKEAETKGRAEGQAEGQAHSVLTILETRGFTITDDIRTQVTNCTDLNQLNIWLRRAVTISDIDDLFAEAITTSH